MSKFKVGDKVRIMDEDNVSCIVTKVEGENLELDVVGKTRSKVSIGSHNVEYDDSRVKDEELLDKLSTVRYGTNFEKLSSHEVKIVNAMYDGCMKILDGILTLTGVEVE